MNIGYYEAIECVCNDGSNRECSSRYGHFVNGKFIPTTVVTNKRKQEHK